MSEETVVHESKEVRTVPFVDFSEARIQLLKDTVCKGATNDELRLFVEVCNLKQLNPFAKQIYAIKRWDPTVGREVMTYQTGIDGFRLIAERTGNYQGQEAPMWCGRDGNWVDAWLESGPPLAAKATVYRKGFAKPLTRIALYVEYVQLKKDGTGTTVMWKKMPASQLYKCAESLALRAAFPEELSGLHTSDEMGQADNAPEEPPAGSMGSALQQNNMRRADIPPAVKSAAGAEVIPDDVLKLWARMTSVKTNVDTFHQLKRELADALGADTAERMYNEKLAKYGVEHSNQFPSFGRARGAARELYEALKLAQTLHVTANDIVVDSEFDEAAK